MKIENSHLTQSNASGVKTTLGFPMDATNECILALITFFGSGIYKLREHEPPVSVKDFRNFAKDSEENDDGLFENNILVVAYKLVRSALNKGAGAETGHLEALMEHVLAPLFVQFILTVRKFEDSSRKNGITEVNIYASEVLKCVF